MAAATTFTDVREATGRIHWVSCTVAGAPIHRARCPHDLVGVLLSPHLLHVDYFADGRTQVRLAGPVIDPRTLDPIQPDAEWATCDLDPALDLMPEWLVAFVDRHQPPAGSRSSQAPRRLRPRAAAAHQRRSGRSARADTRNATRAHARRRRAG